MREFFIQITDVVKDGELTAQTQPSIINKAGIAGEHNASRLIFSLPESWDAEWEYQVECVNSTNEGAVSEPLTVSEERTVVFDIPQGMTQAGQGNYTLQGIKREGDEVVSIYRSATVNLYFAKSPKLGTRVINAIENVLSELFAKINNLVDRFNAGDFNGKDGEKGEKGDKGDKGDRGDDGIDSDAFRVVYTLPEKALEGETCFYAVTKPISTNDSGKVIGVAWDKFLEDVYYDLSFSANETQVCWMSFSVTDKILAIVEIDEKYRWDFTARNGKLVSDAENTFTNLITNEVIPLTELPKYFELPEFDSVEVYDPDNINDDLFYSEIVDMVYQNGRWIKSSNTGGGLTPEQAAQLHTHDNKDVLDSIGYDDNGTLLIGGDGFLNESTISSNFVFLDFFREEIDRIDGNVNILADQIDGIEGGINEIETMIDESGVLD